MAQVAFRQWQSSTIIGGQSLSIRASVQPDPDPPAVVLSTDRTLGGLVVPLADWPTIVATVKELEMESGLSGGN